MLFKVAMTVRLPHDMPRAQADELKSTERAVAQQLQRDGTWRHLWRVAGRYANVSIFDVADADELHIRRGVERVVTRAEDLRRIDFDFLMERLRLKLWLRLVDHGLR